MTRCCRAAAVLVLAACAVGCLGVRQIDLLEDRLRQQEDALYAIRSELQSKDAELAAAHREIDLLRSERTADDQAAMPSEHVAVVTRVTGIRFHSLLTRTLDRDNQPGDDVLNVVLTPHDADDEAVKLPGGIRLELLDLSKPEGERTVAAWDFKPEEAREHWHSGFLSTGYRFELPWPETVTSPNLLLLGRMTIHDGRHFDTTQPITVRLPDAPSRVVDRPPGGESASDPVGPARIQETGTTPAEANDESTGLDPATFGTPFPLSRTEAEPAPMLPLDDLERGEGGPSGLAQTAAPLHRLGSPVLEDNRPRMPPRGLLRHR